jgi:hypothetical protein
MATTPELVTLNDFSTQPVKQSRTYGTSTGGSAFSALSGNYVSRLTFYSNSTYVLIGMVLTYDNGVSITVGSASSGSSVSIDLSQDSVSKFYVQTTSAGFSSGVGVSCVYLATIGGHTLCTNPNSSPTSNPTSWTLVLDSATSQPLENAVLVGVGGRSGSQFDQMQFFYKDDTLINYGMYDVVYGSFSLSDTQEISVATASVSNQTTQTQQMSISFSEAIGSTYTFSTTAGVSAGVKTTVNAGIPFVVNGQVEVSATVSLNITVGVSVTVTDTFSYQAVLAVAGGQTVQASATASSSSLSASYTAKFSQVWMHAGAVTKEVTGSLRGIPVYDVVVSYSSPSS